MKYYYITATMKNGDKWSTRRDSFKEMDSAVKDIMKDKDVKSFSVTEMNSVSSDGWRVSCNEEIG